MVTAVSLPMQMPRLARLVAAVLIPLALACSGNGKTGQKLDSARDQAVPEAAGEVGRDLASPEDAPLGGADAEDVAPDTASAWLDLASDGASWAEAGAEPGMLDAGTDGGEPEAGASPTPIDAAADSVAEMPCDQIVSAYAAFLAAHRDCSTVSDCTVVGGAGTCSCAPTLGNGSGDAIAVSAGSDAYAYFSRAQICMQQGLKIWSICDAAPAGNLRCEAGKCTADEASCMVFGG